MNPDAAYRELSGAVLGYLRARGARDPEDTLGDVFLQVTRDLPRFADADDPVALRRWIFTIARNRLIDAGRRDRRRLRSVRVAAEEPMSEPEDLPDPELLAGLAQLTDEQREVLALRFVADLALEEVSRITGRSTGAVKALQHRALEQLRIAVSPPSRRAL